MKKFDKPENCPVCFEELNDTDFIECGHWVHMECIKKSNTNKCPICRHKLSSQFNNLSNIDKSAPALGVILYPFDASVSTLPEKLDRVDSPLTLIFTFPSAVCIKEFVDETLLFCDINRGGEIDQEDAG